MYLPSGFTEEEVVETIRKVAHRLSRKYRFGFYSREDIEQQAFIIVIKSDCLKKYDPKRPLENFIAIHLRNRLYNFKRDNYTKPDSPCKSCPLKAYIPPDGCSAFHDKMECSFFSRWTKNNASRKNIIDTTDIDYVEDAHEKRMSYRPDVLSDLSNNETHEDILQNLSFRNRKTYIMFLNNCSVKTADMSNMQEEIKEIIGDKDAN